MVLNLHRVNYDGTANKMGSYWSWIEICDRCGKLIYDESVIHSSNQDALGENLCIECMRRLIDKEIAKNDRS